MNCLTLLLTVQKVNPDKRLTDGPVNLKKSRMVVLDQDPQPLLLHKKITNSSSFSKYALGIVSLLIETRAPVFPSCPRRNIYPIQEKPREGEVCKNE
jgi:hypothetical protein